MGIVILGIVFLIVGLVLFVIGAKDEMKQFWKHFKIEFKKEWNNTLRYDLLVVICLTSIMLTAYILTR